MVHILLPSGQRLRLRLYPRPKTRADNASTEAPETLLVPHDPDSSVITAAEVAAARVINFCLVNRVNAAIIDRFPRLGIRDWWLTSGCLAQTIWNLRSGRPSTEGIGDYDIVYFSEDLTMEAEKQVMRDAQILFADLGADIDVRNQARVHLWYPEKFGIAYSPLTSASEGILRFPSTTTAVGLKRTGDEFLDLYAPFGIGNLWDMVVKPNRALPLAEVYKDKTARWQNQWPKLVVRPWAVEKD